MSFSTTLVLRISRTAWQLSVYHLCPFALRLAFPTSLVGRDAHDYYRHSVPMGVAPVGNPIFLHNETYEWSVRRFTHHLHETLLVPIRTSRGYVRTATSFRVLKGSGFKRSARGRVLASSAIEVRAIRLSPSCAERAGLKLQRFHLSLCFLGMLLSPLAFTAR